MKLKPKYLGEWEQEMDICIRCAYCFEGCPVFKDLGWEADGSRGKIILSYGLLTGKLEPSQYIADKIFQCTYCKDCIERCSANVSVPDILTATRADLVNAGFEYEAHKNLLNKIKQTGNIFGKKIECPIQKGEIPVLLGCRFLERTDDAKKYLEILKKLGVQPKVVDETCCGMPFAVLGYKEDLAAHMDTKHFNQKNDCVKEEGKKLQNTILKIAPGEAHLQNIIKDKQCYICKKKVEDDIDGDIVLIRKDKNSKEMVFACTHHNGIVQEFIKQYNRAPLGWRRQYAGSSNDKTNPWHGNPVQRMQVKE